jgi:hypothetical protein
MVGSAIRIGIQVWRWRRQLGNRHGLGPRRGLMVDSKWWIGTTLYVTCMLVPCCENANLGTRYERGALDELLSGVREGQQHT